MNTLNSVWLRNARWVLMLGGAMLVLITMTGWGGTARPGPVFWLGVAALSSTLVIFAALLWWLFLSPLPRVADPQSASASSERRQVVAALVVVSGLLFITGGVWDEVWHRTYGVGAALDDFLWRPHQLIYGSMGLMALFALFGVLVGLRGQGGLRQRFRSEPMIGLVGLAAAYLSLSAPSDLVWHQIYGLDITAWSLPHMLFGVGVGLVMFCALALQLSVLPKREWRSPWGLSFGEGLALMMLAIFTTVALQIALTEWESVRSIAEAGSLGRDLFREAFWNRPEWLYPTLALGIAALVSNAALHATRRLGAATLVALMVLGFRVLIMTVLDLWTSPIHMTVASQLISLPPAIALDGWYALRHRRADQWQAQFIGIALAVLAFMLMSLPLIPLFLVYPRIIAATVPGMVLAGTLAALWSGWVGARLGQGLRQFSAQQSTPATAFVPARVMWLSAGALMALAVLALVFIITAEPPV
jgi:hypothetical protein